MVCLAGVHIPATQLRTACGSDVTPMAAGSTVAQEGTLLDMLRAIMAPPFRAPAVAKREAII